MHVYRLQLRLTKEKNSLYICKGNNMILLQLFLILTISQDPTRHKTMENHYEKRTLICHIK